MKSDFLLEIEPGKFVSYNTKYGAEIYRRSLTLLLQCAISELYPDIKIQVGQSLMQGYYFEFPHETRFPEHFIGKTSERMREIASRDERFRKVRVSREEAVDLYRKKKRTDKVECISALSHKKLELVFLRNYFDFILAECVTSTKFLSAFKLIRYNHGFILQFPVKGDPFKLPLNPDRQEKLFKIYVEAKEWNRILEIQNVSDLNEAVRKENISLLIKIQEAFHEKKIGLIADQIKSFYPEKRLIFVSGPSASGKTTFLKRLGIQIRANGFVPEEISLDDFFVSREETPRTPDGDYDYECLEALDVSYFNRQITGLMKGKEVSLPRYNFKTGCREESGRRLKLRQNSIVLVEGIHALNPKLSSGIRKERKYKIFVSALTQLCIDNDTRIFTSDSRLMRRIIRDYLFRGYSAHSTIKRFPKVREGEEKNIFPFQDNADVFFNSSVIYEQAVLKPMIQPLLQKIRERCEEYYEARRILHYLDFFLPVSSREVPQTSILREFIGKSGFKY